MFDLISISEAIKRSYDSEGLIVDVRSEEVFKKGHLPMAVNDSVGIHAYSVVGGIMFYKGYLEKEKNDLWTMVRTS